MQSKLIQIPIGTKFGNWTVLSFAEKKGHSSFWNCLCICGNKYKINGYTLRKGTSSKCLACKMKNLQSKENIEKRHLTRVAKRPKFTSAINTLISSYKRNAEKRGYIFSLTRDQFVILIKNNCHYCNRVPSSIVMPWHPDMGILKYNGIDRKDNSLGYILNNCVSCCSICNKAKLTMSYEEFRYWVKTVFNNFGNKNV